MDKCLNLLIKIIKIIVASSHWCINTNCIIYKQQLLVYRKQIDARLIKFNKNQMSLQFHLSLSGFSSSINRYALFIQRKKKKVPTCNTW